MSIKNFLISYLEGKPVGYIRYYLPGHHAFGDVLMGEQTFVREGYRSRGIAKKMSCHLVGFAHNKLKLPMLGHNQNILMKELAASMVGKKRRMHYGKDKKTPTGPNEEFRFSGFNDLTIFKRRK